MNKSSLLEKAQDVYSKTQVKKLEGAIDFASKRHAGQKRASGEKYIVHPLATVSYLIDWGMDIDSIIAGILHDTVEDCGVKLSEIKEKFGDSVAFLVDGVTKLGKVRAGMQDIDAYLPKTKDNLTKLLIATGADIRVIIIKLADRLHNLETLSALSPDKQKKIARESLEVFAPLADRLNMGRVRIRLEELAFSYLDPSRYGFLKKQIKNRIGRASKKLDNARAEISKALDEQGIEFALDGRVKSVYSLHKKLAKCDQNIDGIYDIIALRVIVSDKPTCYQVLGIIHSLYMPRLDRIKDYIAMPKHNGYQSLHTTVITRDEHIIEIQVRTRQMHEYAENGLAASFHYNEQKLTDTYKTGKISKLPVELRWILDLQKAAAQLKAGKKVDLKKMRLNLFSNKIFVYSPKGDIFELPEGSMPLDFAYRIHTDIGKNASGFKINGKIVKANTKLKTGDVVEILTSPKAKPTIEWLNRTISKFAHSKIRQELKKLNVPTPVVKAKQKSLEAAKAKQKTPEK